MASNLKKFQELGIGQSFNHNAVAAQKFAVTKHVLCVAVATKLRVPEVRYGRNITLTKAQSLNKIVYNQRVVLTVKRRSILNRLDAQ